METTNHNAPAVEIAQTVLDIVGSREKALYNGYTTVTSVLARARTQGVTLYRSDALTAFRTFEAKGFGKLRLGRRGFQTRFVWTVDPRTTYYV